MSPRLLSIKLTTMIGSHQAVGSGRSRTTPSVRAWVKMGRFSQKLLRVLAEDLGGWGLNLAQFDVLAQVGAAEGLTQQELADSLLVTKGNVCQVLDRMERRGLVSRRPEGRANRLYLTREGRSLYERVVPAHEALVDERFSVLSREEQEKLLELLRKLDHTT